MVYSGKETEELKEVRVPKNIRQIGDNKSNRKIYIEDYVMTHLKKKPDREENIKYGVLLGEIKRAKGNTYVFVRGMVETREIIENSVIFNDDIWAAIYKDIKTYFEGFEIVGWFVSVPYTVKNEMTSIQKIHLDNFAGNDKLCYLSDRTEHEDGFYSYEFGEMTKQSGYYIFYEKNEKMKKYLKQTQGNRGVAVDGSSEKSKTVVNATAKANVSPKGEKKVGGQTGENEKTRQHLSFRDMLKQQIDEENGKIFKPGRIAYGISSLLIIALLLSTVVMLNNYGELKKLKNSIEKMSGDDSVQAVNEILSSIMPTTQANEEGITDKNGEAVSGAQNEGETTMGPNGQSGEETTGNLENVSDNQETEPVQVEPNDDPDDEENNQQAAASIYSGTYHKVEAGQTLYDISIAYYGTSKMVEQIKELNSIDDDYLIKEGQQILLP